ncbi:MAG: hypothetical protein ACM3MI_02310 [Clostridiales bacterium]
MIKRVFVYLLFTLFLTTILDAQNFPSIKDYFNSGISIRGGISHLVLKDEFISQEKYTGFAPYYALDWSNIHDSYGFHFTMDLINTNELKNYNMSAKMIECSMSLGYMYDIGNTELYSRKIYFMLGPAPEIYIHFRSQNIAKGGLAIFDAYSFAALFSAGIRLDAYYPINNDFALAGSLQSSLISLAAKYIDPENKSKSLIKITAPYSDGKYSFEASAAFSYFRPFKFQAGYRFKFIRLTSWDYLASAGDNLFLTLTYML